MTEPLRIVVVHPGASMATHDVWAGLTSGLRALGHTIYDYALDARIEDKGEWLHYKFRKSKRKGVEFPQPTPDLIQYEAAEQLVARCLRVLPDVVLIVSGMFLHPDAVVLLKRAGLKVAILFTESPYDDERQRRLVPFIDVAWTNERLSAKAMGVRYLPHARNADLHSTLNVVSEDTPRHDVVFVGTGFAERLETLAAVDWTGIDLGLYGGWDLMGSRSHLRKYLKGSYISNEHATALYRTAKIGLNLYRTSKGFGKDAPRIAHAESLNPRAYELAATGCFTISDARPEVTEKFGDLVPTFTDASEIRPLLDRWLSDDIGRARIQYALPACVASETWHERAKQVSTDLHGVGIVATRAHWTTELLNSAAAGG